MSLSFLCNQSQHAPTPTAPMSNASNDLTIVVTPDVAIPLQGPVEARGLVVRLIRKFPDNMHCN